MNIYMNIQGSVKILRDPLRQRGFTKKIPKDPRGGGKGEVTKRSQRIRRGGGEVPKKLAKLKVLKKKIITPSFGYQWVLQKTNILLSIS